MPRSLSFKMSEKKSFHDSISILVCAHWRTLTIIITKLSPDAFKAEQAEQQGLKSHSWPQLIFLFSITAWTLTFIQILLRKHLRSKILSLERASFWLSLCACSSPSFAWPLWHCQHCHHCLDDDHDVLVDNSVISLADQGEPFYHYRHLTSRSQMS